jgi:hypothetical protein
MGMTIVANGHSYRPISTWSYGKIEIGFSHLMKAPFSIDKRSELLKRLNEIGGMDLPAAAITLCPSFPAEKLASGERLASFLGVMDWLVQELRAG